MAPFGAQTWLLLGGIGAVGAVAFLWVLSEAFAHERKVHELKARVFELRRAYAHRLAAMAAREVEPVGAGAGEADAEIIEAAPVEEAA